MERWEKVKGILSDALELEGEERRAFVRAACASDGELLAEVESLLANQDELGGFLQRPLLGFRSARWRHGEILGQRIGPYEIQALLGHGGMGAVYLAERVDGYHQRVALKLLKRGMDSEEILSRFESERQILARLVHPNIAQLHDGGTFEDLPYFAMELVEGEPIDRYCDAHRLSVQQRVELFQSVCSAVHFAHQNLIIHRDLKPANILVAREGRPKLLDFGIAKILSPSAAAAPLTAAGLYRLTPDYASPEQRRGEPVTVASDIYSLGVVLYELLTGRKPRPSARTEGSEEPLLGSPLKPSTAVRRPHADGSSGTPGPSPEEVGHARGVEPRQLSRRLSGDLDRVVLKGLAEDPSDRYGSAEQLAEDLRRHLDGLPVIARRHTGRYLAMKFARRHRAWVAAGAVTMLSLIAFGWTMAVQRQRVTAERDVALRERQRAETVITFLEELFEAADPNVARGEPLTAIDLLARGRERIRHGLEDEPETRASVLGTLGNVHRRLGLYEEAERLLGESLRVRERLLGDRHPEVAKSLHNLGSLLREARDLGMAEQQMRRALAIQRAALDDHHPDLIHGLGNLASLLSSKGDHAEAERLYREALATKQRLYGEAHPETAMTLNNLAVLAQRRGDLGPAEELYRRALAIRRRLLGPNHEATAVTISNLATVLEWQGGYREAVDLHREALARKLKVLGEGHPSVAFSRNNLAVVLHALGELTEAEELLRAALDVVSLELATDHTRRALVLKNLAVVLVDAGAAAQAETLAREAVEIFRLKRPGSWQLATAESVLGGCLLELGRLDEAEALLLPSFEALRNENRAKPKSRQDARARVARLYQVLGRPDQVDRFAR